jgi:hypothetical protein
MAAGGIRWLAQDSPGRPGDRELWIDADAMDYGGGMEPSIVEHVLRSGGGGPWIGQPVRFPGGTCPETVYLVVSRRTSQANLGRPYYVLKCRDEEGVR